VTRLVWEKISSSARNEALDVRDYALAAMELLKPNYDALERRLKETDENPKTKQIKSPATIKKRFVKKANIW